MRQKTCKRVHSPEFMVLHASRKQPIPVHWNGAFPGRLVSKTLRVANSPTCPWSNVCHSSGFPASNLVVLEDSFFYIVGCSMGICNLLQEYRDMYKDKGFTQWASWRERRAKKKRETVVESKEKGLPRLGKCRQGKTKSQTMSEKCPGSNAEVPWKNFTQVLKFNEMTRVGLSRT